MKTTVYLIRHSEAMKGEFQQYLATEIEQISNEKTCLSIEGEQKAEQLSKNPLLSHLDVIYSSHYTRAISTAKWIARQNHLKINVDERLGERKIGIQYRSELPPYFSYRQWENWDYKHGNGESFNDCKKRIKQVFDDILNQQKGKNIAIVSHGVSIKALLSVWCDMKLNEQDKQFDIYYHDQLVISGKWHSPELFKLVFDETFSLISIQKI